MKTRHANPWLYFGPHGANSQIRLLCLPYAGGNVSLFRSWSQQLPGEIQVCAVQLPGRQTRFQEPPITRMDALIDRLMEVVRPLSDLPLAIFGQCAGALVGFELARRLRQEQPPRPLAHLFAVLSLLLPAHDDILYAVPPQEGENLALARRLVDGVSGSHPITDLLQVAPPHSLLERCSDERWDTRRPGYSARRR